MLAVIYVLLFLLQLFLLVRCFRRRTGWGLQLALNIASTVISGGLIWYFDRLSNTVAMAGWAYFMEVFYSICACGGFFLLTLISTVGSLLVTKKSNCPV